MADESLLECLVQLKGKVDKAMGDPPIDADASSPALLDAYVRIRAEVRSFVSSLDDEDQINLCGDDGLHSNPLDSAVEAFPYLRAERDASKAEVELRALGDWLQDMIEVETLAQQWGGSRKAYRAAHVQLDRA
jgi:hypothetical protein